jgi:tRNA 5-methylaminomethyl-2-thiouridine biosynthesis bifunctional protein
VPGPLLPAALAFTAGGTPYSAAYGDVYHSAEGGPAQARHVFLDGNGLPERWRGRRAFTILETGFGFGLSFLATWQAWREDPARCGRLHFVSVEKHPFATPDLALLSERFSETKEKGKQLVALWPMLVAGMHRLEFEDGNVVLTLFFGDVAEGLPQLQLAADAFYLDGFAPAKNPQMWEPRLLRHLGRRPPSPPGASPPRYARPWKAPGLPSRSAKGSGRNGKCSGET